MLRAAEPELCILPRAGAQIENEEEPELKLKLRSLTRSSV